MGVLQSYCWWRTACIACPSCVYALHQVWLYEMHSLFKTPTAVFTCRVTVHQELCLSHMVKIMKWAHHCTAARTVIKNKNLFVCFWSNSSPPPIGPGSPPSRSFYITHNDAPQPVGLLCKSNQLDAETSTWQHTALTRDRHSCPRWDSNQQSQQASGRRPTP